MNENCTSIAISASAKKHFDAKRGYRSYRVDYTVDAPFDYIITKANQEFPRVSFSKTNFVSRETLTFSTSFAAEKMSINISTKILINMSVRQLFKLYLI